MNNLTTVTVKTADNTWKQQVDVPSQTSFGDFRQAAQQQAGILDVPYILIHDKTDRAMKDNDTFALAKIPNNSSFTLVPEAEGG